MKLKKTIATLTAATMVMASAMTVCAADFPNLKGSNTEVLVAGDTNLTCVAGDYSSRIVRGAAVLTPYEDVKAALGLNADQRPSIVVYDAEDKSSPEAFASLNTAVEELGGETVGALYIELGGKENGKWITTSDGTVTVKAGLPKTADKSKSYSIVRVEKDGVTTVLEDLDNSDKTVTFEAVSGVATYGIVAK